LIENVDAGTGALLVPLSLGAYRVYVSIPESLSMARPGSEDEIATRAPSLDSMLGGVVAFAEELAARLRTAEVSKLNVEFGCEFAFESGGFVAVIGKASAKSAVKVGLEWVKPTA